MVRLSYSSQVEPRPAKTSRTYAAVFIGSHLVELSLDRNLHAIRLDLHVSSAFALLQQVGRWGLGV